MNEGARAAVDTYLDKLVREARQQALIDARAAVRAEFDGKDVPSGIEAIGRAARAVTRLINDTIDHQNGSQS